MSLALALTLAMLFIFICFAWMGLRMIYADQYSPFYIVTEKRYVELMEVNDCVKTKKKNVCIVELNGDFCIHVTRASFDKIESGDSVTLTINDDTAEFELHKL